MCAQVEEAIDKFVEAQIVKIDDNKWGNKLSQVRAVGAAVHCWACGGAGRLRAWERAGACSSPHAPPTHPLPFPLLPARPPAPQKLFMGREFVVKHIRNKHGHVVEAERERLQEEIFWENFRWAPGCTCVCLCVCLEGVVWR